MLRVNDKRDNVSWSPSSLQRMTVCGHSYYMRYVLRHQPRPHAAAWFGGEIVHRIIERAYHGMPLLESFDTTWSEICAPVWPDLVAWLDLDRAYQLARGGKRSDSREGIAWRREHPEYDERLARIAAYQNLSLSYLRWNERVSLADYFRRSAILTEVPRDQVLLANPWLVEGQWLSVPAEEEGLVAALEEGEEDEEKGLEARMLAGKIGAVKVRGIPDVVAQGPDDVLLIADYKTSARPLTREQLAGNVQLLVYCELLRQNGILLPGQQARVGHIYLTEAGVTQVWAETDRHAQRLPLLEQQVAQAERRRAQGDFMPVAGIHSSFQDPCPTCDMAHVCDLYALLNTSASHAETPPA